jgi:hypothetical protein
VALGEDAAAGAGEARGRPLVQGAGRRLGKTPVACRRYPRGRGRGWRGVLQVVVGARGSGRRQRAHSRGRGPQWPSGGGFPDRRHEGTGAWRRRPWSAEKVNEQQHLGHRQEERRSAAGGSSGTGPDRRADATVGVARGCGGRGGARMLRPGKIVGEHRRDPTGAR